MTELYNCFLEKRYPEEWDVDWKENTHYSLGLFLVQYLGNGFNLADAAHLTYNDQWNPIRSKNDYARGCQKFKNHMEASHINILNNKQMSRSGSHRYETHTKTNYENNEYIYLMGYITSSFLPFFSVDEV